MPAHRRHFSALLALVAALGCTDSPLTPARAPGTVTYLTGGTARVSGAVRWKTTGAPGARAQSHLQLTGAR